MEGKKRTYWGFLFFVFIYVIALVSILFKIKSFYVVLTFSIPLIFYAFLSKSKKNAGFFVLLVIFISIGFHFYVKSEKKSYERAKSGYERILRLGRYREIEGTIVSDPEKYKYNRVRFELKNSDKRYPEIKGYILNVYVNTERFPVFYRGEKVRLYGRLYPLSDYSNFHKNFLNYYNFSKKIIGSIYVKSDGLIRSERVNNPVFYYLSRYKLMFSKFVSNVKVDEIENLSIIKAITIGERKSIPENLKFLWKESGIYHLLAISGAHIGIISFLLFYLFRFVGISKRNIYKIQIILIFTFMLFIGNNPPVVRASFMVLLFFIGKLLWKDTDLLHIVSISGILYLFFSPLSVVNIGFILTYFITIFLILTLRELKGVFDISTKVEQSLYIVLLAFLLSFPLNLYFFNYISFGSIILNFLSMIIIPATLFFSISSLLLFWITPSTGAFLVKISSYLIGVINYLSEKIGKPISLRSLTPPFWLVCVYIVLFLFLFFTRKKRGIIGLLWFFSFFSLIFYPEKSIKKPAVYFLDVGEGDASYIEIPSNYKVLIDCGGSYKKDNFIGEYIVSSFLFKNRIRTIDAVFISHFHPDHYYGCLRVIKNFKVKKLYYYNTMKEENLNELFDAAKEKGVEIVKLNYGDKIRIGEANFRVIHPKKEIIKKVTNNDSMVLKLSLKKYGILYTGDIEKEAEEEIVGREKNLNSYVLKVAHHGSRTSSTIDFLKAVSPRIAIISVGRGNRYNFPSKFTLEKLKKIGTTVFRTDRDGAVKLLLLKNKLETIVSKK